MKIRIMRQVTSVCVIAVFLTGCSEPNLSDKSEGIKDKIEGIKWAENSKYTYSTKLYRFNDGEIESCLPKKGIWEPAGENGKFNVPYKIDGDFIVLQAKGKEERNSIVFNRPPNGQKATVSFGKQTWYAIEDDDNCPFLKG